MVKNTGDGFLAEFPSAVEAVRAAVQFQTRIRELTVSEAADSRIWGGVNIAARLESIAEPGGIRISSAAYDPVRGKVGIEFADLGEQNLKNIACPVRAYTVVREVHGPTTLVHWRQQLSAPDSRTRRVLLVAHRRVDWRCSWHKTLTGHAIPLRALQ